MVFCSGYMFEAAGDSWEARPGPLFMEDPR